MRHVAREVRYGRHANTVGLKRRRSHSSEWVTVSAKNLQLNLLDLGEGGVIDLADVEVK